jgi:uncharacterized protein HemX
VPAPSASPSISPSPSPSLAPSAATPLAGGGSSSANSNGGAAASSSGATPTATIIIVVVVAVVIIAAAAAAYYFLLQKKKEQHPALSFSEQYGVRPNQRDSFQGASPVFSHQQPRRSSVSSSVAAAASPLGPQRHALGDHRKSLRPSVADVQPRAPSTRGQRPSIAHLAHTRQPSPWAGPYGDAAEL